MLVGVVETAANGLQKPFRTITELTNILTSPKHRSSQVKNGMTNSPSQE